MDSEQLKVARELPGIVRVYEDGRVERFRDTDFVPASLDDPSNGVSSKDVTLLPDSNVSARLYLPKLTNPNQKLPLLVYFHGGAFCVSSPYTSRYHNYVSTLVSRANVIAVSVNYRKAPEHPIPAAYEDSLGALKWVLSHANNGRGTEPWLTEHADFERVFMGGVSAGANIVHNLAMAAGGAIEHELNIGIVGIALEHPYFWGSDSIGSEAVYPNRKASADSLWPFVCPSNPDNDDPRVNPLVAGAPSLTKLGCKRLLVCVAERDVLRDRGWAYYEALGRVGWTGVVEILETEEEDHGFHLFDPVSDKANHLIRRLAAFFNRDMPSF